MKNAVRTRHAERGTSYVSALPNGHTVETWFDRLSRNWITQHMDPGWHQIDHADYTGRKEHAESAHNTRLTDVRAALNLPPL